MYVYVCVFVFIGISEKVEEMIKKRELYNYVFKHDRLLMPVQCLILTPLPLFIYIFEPV